MTRHLLDNLMRQFNNSSALLMLIISLVATEQIYAATSLTNGVAVLDSGAQGTQKMYQITIPSGATNLRFNTSGGTGGGDIDIYAKFNALPSVNSFDLKSDGRTTTESILIAAPKSGIYYLLVYANYGQHSATSVVASFTAPVVAPPPSTFRITSNPIASGVTVSDAAVEWSLSESATGQIEYGTTTAYGKLSTAELSFKYSAHKQTITGLSAATTYHFRIISKNAIGIQVVSSDFSFKTLEAPVVVVPPAPAPTPTPTPTPTPGTVINASSCSYAAVASAVASATAGTTVKIPAGDCNWGAQQLNVPGGVYLEGAGQDITIIRRVGSVSNTAYLVAYNCSNGKQAIFSKMTLIGNGNGSIQDKGLGLLNGCVDFKISNSKFANFIFSAIYVGDAAGQRGVIFKNNFINNFSADLMNLGYGVVVYGGAAWPALDLGSKNAVFIEDNYFSGNRHNVASNNGSVYVFRFNKVVGQDPAKDFAMTDSHGVSSSPRGSRSYEIYNNDYSTNISGGLQRSAIGIRGGDGVIFNNTATASISRTIELMTEGFSCGVYAGPDQIRSLYIWNNTSNSQNGYTTNGIDNTCPSSIGLNRDYFLSAKPGYTPFTYPHPLR
ncbi:MAG: fibronectin type III domain-containing protein [Pseudobdellovibrio sp.]